MSSSSSSSSSSGAAAGGRSQIVLAQVNPPTVGLRSSSRRAGVGGPPLVGMATGVRVTGRRAREDARIVKVDGGDADGSSADGTGSDGKSRKKRAKYWEGPMKDAMLQALQFLLVQQSRKGEPGYKSVRAVATQYGVSRTALQTRFNAKLRGEPDIGKSGAKPYLTPDEEKDVADELRQFILAEPQRSGVAIRQELSRLLQKRNLKLRKTGKGKKMPTTSRKWADGFFRRNHLIRPYKGLQGGGPGLPDRVAVAQRTREINLPGTSNAPQSRI